MNGTKYTTIGESSSRGSPPIFLSSSRSVSITKPTSKIHVYVRFVNSAVDGPKPRVILPREGPLPEVRRNPRRHLRRKRRLSEWRSWLRRQPILSWGKRRGKPLKRVFQRLREKILTEYQPAWRLRPISEIACCVLITSTT
jgi:hypothetical protein